MSDYIRQDSSIHELDENGMVVSTIIFPSINAAKRHNRVELKNNARRSEKVAALKHASNVRIDDRR